MKNILKLVGLRKRIRSDMRTLFLPYMRLLRGFPWQVVMEVSKVMVMTSPEVTEAEPTTPRATVNKVDMEVAVTKQVVMVATTPAPMATVMAVTKVTVAVTEVDAVEEEVAAVVAADLEVVKPAPSKTCPWTL